eukprot:TRINITY_DN3303_c0_g3_i1.p1 TRINITY_DN3303_c0_g3~~TRINITY_DN3303_c0_g3_i1.p1  ORF type:complete len:285 (+),score=59.71 TRINITY_DN3303_c0_g3_i1:323-1177(+)
MTCRQCSTVLEERRIDERSEWRTFSNDGSKQGADQNRVGTGYSISSLPVDITTMLSSDSDGKFKNNSMFSTPAEQARHKASSEIIKICNMHDIPYDVTERAQALFMDVEGKKELRGKQVNWIIAACILQATRELKTARTLQEISAITGVPGNKIIRVLNLIRQVAKVESYVPLTGSQFMARYCSNFKWQDRYILRASQLYDSVQEAGYIIGAKCPISVAAACAYMVTQLVDGSQTRKPQEVATDFGIKDATLLQAYADIYKHREHLVSTHFPEIPDGPSLLVEP